MTDVLVVSQKKTAVVSPPPACTLGKHHITIYKTELKAGHQNFVPSHQMPRSTRQLTTDWPKQTTFDWLYKRVWKNKYLKKGAKVSVYRAVVLTIPSTL